MILVYPSAGRSVVLSESRQHSVCATPVTPSLSTLLHNALLDLSAPSSSPAKQLLKVKRTLCTSNSTCHSTLQVSEQ